jgi:predicted MPP superfamily phosphohydrolase
MELRETTMLRLVHLSDIHFNRQYDGPGFDPDEDLRDRLASDLEQFAKERGSLTALLVSGDVAYSGKKVEYDNASAWLDRLCKVGGCPPDAVYVAPGNHDVDQSIIRANSLLQDAHDAIRAKATPVESEAALLRRLEEPDARTLFYAPLRDFNEFAARYECSFFADKDSYAWEHPLTLNDGSVLKIRGLNSAILSGLSDDIRRLFLGSRATTLPRRSGVEYLTLCHHPPNWLLDEKDVVSALDDGARVQLFGHEHDQRIDFHRDTAKLFAGAVNPRRDEKNWRPGYNILEVSVQTNAGRRRLIIDVHAREWQNTVPRQFRAIEDRGNKPVHHQEIDLDSWESPKSDTAVTTQPPSAPESPPQAAELQRAAAMTPREVIHRFFKLSISKKSEILGQLDLLAESDRALPDVEKSKRALLRAKERGLLDKLSQLIVQAEK